jgi:ureidoglycolate lyase
VPLAPFRFIVVVAPAGPAVTPDDLRAFVTNGQQGISYARGVWHMPLIALEAGQQFLVVDRYGADNCDEHVLDTPVRLYGE